MAEITFTLMTPEDLDRVHEIELSCFTVPWSRQSFENETKNDMARYILIREDGTIVGYAGVWLVLDEAHVTNIAIAPEWRCKGYGKKLTARLIQLAADTGMTWMTLECRRSNIVAQNLYHSLGFTDVGWRKRYYEDNHEDALVMALEDMPEAHPEDDPFLTEEDA